MDVAIIGAGLAGTLIAISLRQSLPADAKITIFESRQPDAPELASGVVLTPNGLHILDQLGVYSRIKDICWTNSYRTYKNDKDETIRRVLVASEELYGFKNHRLYRRVLLATTKTMCEEASIPIHYNHRFEGITSDTSTGISFKINDTNQTATLLIGADGIYSSVRKYLYPTINPEYTGTLGILAHIQWSSIAWPTPDFEHQCTVQGKPGAFFMIPETKDGSEVMVGIQHTHPAQTRQEWESLASSPDLMTQFFRKNYEEWHDTGKKVIDAVCDPARGKGTLYCWPFLRMPRLEKWYSETGNVILVGDAAHAIPPSSGQGVNQALEDVYALTLLLKPQHAARKRIEALRFWQELRQKRVDAVFDWATNATNVARMPEDERKRLIAEGKVPDPDVKGSGFEEFFDDMKWLYVSDAETRIQEWLDSH